MQPTCCRHGAIGLVLALAGLHALRGRCCLVLLGSGLEGLPGAQALLLVGGRHALLHLHRAGALYTLTTAPASRLAVPCQGVTSRYLIPCQHRSSE